MRIQPKAPNTETRRTPRRRCPPFRIVLTPNVRPAPRRPYHDTRAPSAFCAAHLFLPTAEPLEPQSLRPGGWRRLRRLAGRSRFRRRCWAFGGLAQSRTSSARSRNLAAQKRLGASPAAPAARGAGTKRVHAYTRGAPTPVGAEAKSPVNAGDSPPVGAYGFRPAMHRTQEVAGSSPASSINESPPNGRVFCCPNVSQQP
jgi:hypothetical protein